jgi:hypothetical protein
MSDDQVKDEAPTEQAAKPASAPRARRTTTTKVTAEPKVDASAFTEAAEATPSAPQPAVRQKDPFGVDVPTVEEFVHAGGASANYEEYVFGRLHPGSVAAAPVPAVASPSAVKSRGVLMAEQLLYEQKRKRTGQSIEPPLPEEEMKEDWQEIQKGKKEPAPKEFEGLYLVTHGALFFRSHTHPEGEKIVPKGRKVHLSAEDAKNFLELEMVRPLRTVA